MTTPNSTTTPKRCTTCGNPYPATTEYFHKNRGGLYPSCKACVKAYTALYNAEHREELRTNAARYRAEHPEYRMRYYAEHREKERASQARYAADHSNEILRWRADHADEIRASQARWRAENPEAVKAKAHRRKARNRQLADTLTTREWKRCLEYFGNKCAYCGKAEDFWTVIVPDHYIALKDPREDNPGTVALNIIPACHGRKGVPTGDPCCNNSKTDKDPVEWLEQRFGKRKAKQIASRIRAYFVWVEEQSK